MSDEKSKDLLNTPPPAPGVGDFQHVIVLNLITGQGKDEKKKTFKLNRRRVVIGSALSSDVRIQQNSVSNVHAVIEMNAEGKAHIYDMASETGLFVNGKKEISVDLKDGDEIKIGFATLAFRRSSVAEVQAATPAQRVKPAGHRKLFLSEKEDFRPLILEDERNVIQIFDYPPGSQRALQAVMYWGAVIMSVKHFTQDESVSIGDSEKADFVVPGVGSSTPLVSVQGGEVSVHITPEMKGVVRARSGLRSFDELRKEKGSSSFVLSLRQDDMAKIEIHGMSFFLGYSPVPPHLRARRILERDPLYTRIWFTSLGLTLALILLVLSMSEPEPLPVEELPPQVTSIIFKEIPPPPPPVKEPPKPKEPEPPKAEEPVKEPPKPVKPKPVEHKTPTKKLPTEVKNPPVKVKPSDKPVTAANQIKGGPAKKAGGDAGEGARAAGPEGRKGKPDAPAAKVPQQASRGTPNAPGSQKSLTQGKGNVESFFGDIQGTISQNLAAGSKGASMAADRIKGFGGQTTQGEGGLGEVGSGKGGGGKSLDVAGLGTKGVGEGAFGKGLGAIGSGGNIVGTGRGRPSIEVGNAAETIVMGGLDKDVIDRIIKENISKIRYCYEIEANKNPSLRGRIMTRFVIAATGRVSQSGIEATSMQNPGVERCLTSVIQKIQFPEPVGGTLVEVSYPFQFTPAGGGSQ